MTIPALVKNYQKYQTVIHLKQTYNLIFQAFQRSEVDNGFMESWEISNASWDANAYEYGKLFFEKYIKSYLKIIKECKYKSNECWADKYTTPNGKNHSYAKASSNNTYTVVLQNGSVLGFWPRGSCGEIYIDINGKKGPNVVGKDLFDITFHKTATNNKIRFYGYSSNRNDLKNNTTMGCSKQGTGTINGTYCGALIMFDNWQISEDYPW